MKRVYKFEDYDFTATGTAQGLVTNGFGGYFALDTHLNHQGWHLLQPSHWKMNKILDAITPLHEGTIQTLYTHPGSLRRYFTKGSFDVFTPYQNVLFYQPHALSSQVQFTFDHRESSNSSSLERDYDITVSPDFVLVTFITKNSQGVHKKYVGIKGISDITLVKRWRKKQHSSNTTQSAKDMHWVFDAFTCKATPRVVLSAGATPAQARTLADIAYHHYDSILATIHHKKQKRIGSYDLIEDRNIQTAARSASSSLQSLYNYFSFDHHLVPGIYAGLPYVFHLWSRDELCSLKGLFLLAQQHNRDTIYAELKHIFSRYLQDIRGDGTLNTSYPRSKTKNIDCVGWLAVRLKEYISLLEDESKLFTTFQLEELLAWHHALLGSLEKLKRYRQHDNGLFFNNPQETWMDTAYLDGDREGFRIEIQALIYNLYGVVIYLGTLLDVENIEVFKTEQDALLRAITQYFTDKSFQGIILDGLDAHENKDFTYRPNIFLAYYVAPQLFSTSQWKKAFQAHLDKLWLPWGGISTLAQSHPLFEPRHTKQKDTSYHRGDSWYYLNNIIALSLHRLDKELFYSHINKILQASSKEIVECGFMGHAGELSSALVYSSQGSPVHALSASSFLELIDELYCDEE